MKQYHYDEINIGDEASFEKAITSADVNDFSRLSGDVNPLHCDSDYAKETPYGSILVHGMLASSLFSQLVGVHLPGKYCLYISQDIQFRNAIYPSTKLVVSGKVIAKMDAYKMLTIETAIRDTESNRLCITGQAKVKVLK